MARKSWNDSRPIRSYLQAAHRFTGARYFAEPLNCGLLQRDDLMKPGILSIDIGGTGLKAAVLDQRRKLETARVRIPTPHPCPPEVMLAALAQLVATLPAFDRISVGFPGVIRDGVVQTAPNLGTAEWAGFALAQAISQQFAGYPVKLINDADMQGFSLISGQGVELALTLGTGFGSALFHDGELLPHIELAHHPIHKKQTYDEYLGVAAYTKVGKKRWNRRLQRALHLADALFSPHGIVLGGGNAAKVTFTLPEHVTLGSNQAGIQGGAVLWGKPGQRIRAVSAA